MDQLDVEIIRLLHYAPWDMYGSSESDTLRRRPSPFWIYSTISDKIKSGKLQLSSNGISKTYIMNKIQKLGNCLRVRANLDGRAFGLEEFRILVAASPLSMDTFSFEDPCFDHVNTFHRGLMVSPNGDLISGGSIEYYQKSSDDMASLLSRIKEHHPEIRILNVARKLPPPGERLIEKYRKLQSYDGKLRKGVRTVLTEVLKDPTCKINTIATNTGLSRAHVKKFFMEIAGSGIITMEPTQVNSLVFDSSLAVFLIKCKPHEMQRIIRTISTNSSLGGRVILNRTTEENTIVLLVWTTGYPDVYNLYHEAVLLFGEENVFAAVQAKSIQNVEGIIRLINNS